MSTDDSKKKTSAAWRLKEDGDAETAEDAEEEEEEGEVPGYSQ